MKKHAVFIVFVIFWLILNVVTAVKTELYEDEAYYWMYSQFMAWGYFDHPPGVAVMIKLGSFLGKTELAVRLFNVLFTAISITLVYLLVRPKNALIFCLTVFSFLVIHLIGFVSLPDGPFFLSAILFFMAYRAFLRKNSLPTALLLGLTAALMIYCKYHGFVVILFTLFSNIALFKNYRTYIVAAVALLLLGPHFYWQVDNDFPSLSYHLSDRAAPEYKIRQTLDYLFGNLPFLGGLISVILFIAAISYSPKDIWEKALKWNLFGMYVFFLLITFKGQYIEANWTLFCVFSMLYLGYKKVEDSVYFTVYRYVAFASATVLFIIRIHLLSPFGVLEKDRIWDFYGGQEFAQTVAETARNRRIVTNRYQDASLLNFYLDEPYLIPAININSRASQYSIWRFETLLCGDSVAFVNNALPGIRISSRKFDSTTVSFVDKVRLPSCYELEILSAKRKAAEVTLTVQTELVVRQFETTNENVRIQVTLYTDGKRISEKMFAMNASGTQQVVYPVRPTNQPNRAVVKVYSNQLYGTNNKAISVDF